MLGGICARTCAAVTRNTYVGTPASDLIRLYCKETHFTPLWRGIGIACVCVASRYSHSLRRIRQAVLPGISILDYNTKACVSARLCRGTSAVQLTTVHHNQVDVQSIRSYRSVHARERTVAYSQQQSQTRSQVHLHSMSGTVRASIQRGAKVSVVLKCDQPTGKLTLGVVDALLTNSAQHPQGIKVRLRSGQVGRVKTVHESGDGAEVTSTHQGVIDGGYTGRGSPNNWNRTNNRSRRSPNSQRPSPGGSIAESSNAYRERHRKFGTSARVVNDGYGDDDMSAYMRPSSAEGNVLSAWLAPQLDDGNNDEMDWTTNESPSGLESAENTRVWVCAACTFENSPGSGHCEMCTSVKPVFTSTISPASTPDAETTGQGAQSAVWACVACTYENDQMFSLACAVCSTPRTG